MGNRKTKKKGAGRRGGHSRPEKSRKVDGKGRIKKKRGDQKMVHAKMTGFKVKQKKGGKSVRVGPRACQIHTKCNCVQRSDPSAMMFIQNRSM